MCLSCGCVLASGGSPTDDHGDDDNFTVTELTAAASASGITLEQAAQNIVASLATPTIPDLDSEELVEKRLSVPQNPQRFVLGVAYPSDQLDGHKEWMSAEEVEQTAWDYCRKHRRIGFFHADGTEGHMDLVESYIYRGPDWVTTDIDGNEQVIKAGYWVMGGIADEPGFEAIVAERADGWSMDGFKKRRVAAPGSN